MDSESQTTPGSPHLVERFVPGEAVDDLPDRCPAWHDREYRRTTPGQSWLEQSRCTQPGAQRIEIVSTAPQKLFESIAPTHECRRFNSLAPNGRGKSEVVFPMCQALSGRVVSPECLSSGHGPRRQGHERMQRRVKSQRAEHFPAPRTQRRSARDRERNIGSEFQRITQSARARRCAPVKCEHRGHRGSRIRASAPHTGLHGNALDQREAGTARQSQLACHEPRGAQHEVVGARGYRSLRSRSRPAVNRRVFVPHAQREAAGRTARDQRVGERDRLEHGHQVVKSVGTTRADREAEIELGTRIHGHRARRTAGSCVPVAAAHRVRYRIHSTSATNTSTAP